MCCGVKLTLSHVVRLDMLSWQSSTTQLHSLGTVHRQTALA